MKIFTRTYYYFVSFSYAKGNINGDGNIKEIQCVRPLKYAEDIREVEEYIKEINFYDVVVIRNWIKLKGSKRKNAV